MELTTAERGFVTRGDIPLIGLLTVLARWWEDRHMEMLAEAGFGDLRRAHNAVIVHLPVEGTRLTDVAEAAGISKQATAQLVDDLLAKGYLERRPDPSDGRAKIIAWSDRGKAASAVTVGIFKEMEAQMAELVGERLFQQMKRTMTKLFTALSEA